MTSWLAFLIAAVITATGCLAFTRFAGALGLVDHPGGRKDHAMPVPLVGGLALFFTALNVALFLIPAVHTKWPLLLAPALLVAIGALDDSREIRPRFRFAAQIIACLVMIYVAEIQLNSVGNLVGFGPIGMWLFAIPMTIFAVVGVINAVNMIDGVDGLAGTICMVALGWYGWMAQLSGLNQLALLAIVLCGALAGFLALNLRFPWQPHARVFLGDAGSTFLGFVLAWIALALTQGSGKSIPPICALWVILLPLADTVSLMARRVRRRQSPFQADREHIHHLLHVLGVKQSQILLILILVSAFFGAVGFYGWRMNVPEPMLFWPFFFLFFAYHFSVKAIWRRLYRLGRAQQPELSLVDSR